MRSPCRITVLRHEFIQRYRIAANPFEHTHARRDPQESGELLRRGLAAMLTHRTDRRDADRRGATQMLSRTCELFVPNAEASARPATSCVIVCLLTCSPAHLRVCAVERSAVSGMRALFAPGLLRDQRLRHAMSAPRRPGCVLT
jgi:hypothetical protein